ncbi:MAG: hypothetical protein EXS59_02590 [Candidatus Taylorbacteria bacterium]|nr:hypothetical protein [Candidatus Taylorbacteria bacterium]
MNTIKKLSVLAFALSALIALNINVLAQTSTATIADLPDSLPMLQSVDRLFDNAITQVENGGRAEIYISGGGIVHKPNSKPAEIIEAGGKRFEQVLKEMGSVKFKFPLLDPTKDRVTVQASIYGPAKPNGSRDQLFSGGQGYKLLNIGGKWTVPEGSKKVEMSLNWAVPLDLGLPVEWAAVYLRDESGEGRWQDVRVEDNQIRFQKHFAGADMPIRIGYRRSDGTFAAKEYNIRNATAIVSTEVEPRHAISLDSVVFANDENLTPGSIMILDIQTEIWRFSPLVRITLNQPRSVLVRAAAVSVLAALDMNDAIGHVKEVSYALRLKGLVEGKELEVNLRPILVNGFVQYHEMQLPAGKYSLFFLWKDFFQNKERFSPNPQDGGKGGGTTEVVPSPKG